MSCPRPLCPHVRFHFLSHSFCKSVRPYEKNLKTSRKMAINNKNLRNWTDSLNLEEATEKKYRHRRVESIDNKQIKLDHGNNCRDQI